MKKTQWTDALRNILKQKVSYLSVVLIALLGAGSFLSISYASVSMQKNCSAWYEEMNFRNIEVVSSRLLTAGDLDALRGLEGVTDVEPVWVANGELYKKGKPVETVFISLGERINLPVVKEGRLPQNELECAVESRLAEKMELEPGDVIEDYSMVDESGQYFILWEPLTVTAIVEHPDHLSLNLGEAGYILVLPSAFDHEALQGSCMKAEVLTAALPDENRFSEKNRAASREMADRIEALADVRTPIRDAELKALAYAEADEYEQAYRDMLAEQLELREALNTDPSASEEEIRDNEDYIAMLEESLAGMDEIREKVEKLSPTRWIVLDDPGNPSYVQLLAGSENLSRLRMTFALLFIVISALVIYATVSKMVDEQRTLVGTTKALGFHKREILYKYLIYGVSGTLIGTVIGILLARFWLEGIALKGYGSYISVDITRPRFSLGITLVVLAANLLLAAAAVWFACSRLVRTPAVQLMQPEVPKGKHRAEQGEGRLSLYGRLILRNVRSDWRRVAVTIVSVAGCCTLLVTGFTLRHGVTGCVDNQYGKVMDYDWEIKCWNYAIPDIEEVLDNAGADHVALYRTNLLTYIGETGVATLLCGDLEEINKLYHLLDWKTGEPITKADDGILIQRRLAEIYGLDVGSEFLVSKGLGDPVTVRVAGVFDHYIGLPAAMSGTYFEQVFGEPCMSDTMFVRLNGADEDALTEVFDEMDAVKSFGTGDRASFRSSITVINAIVALLTVMSALLAGVVLMNLTNLFFLQKKREMTIMRVNGFTSGQTIGYLLREIAVTTAVGIVLGIVAGAFMGYYILRSLEQSFVQFDRTVSLGAWGLGAAITVLFAVIVNWAVLRKVKDLKLTDAAE
ncbi:MAG: ABC transporter permease [Lachnospiraceae bacterium]|nr:ABC transporter permease [Lachnospiraceae bacterium]